MPGVIRIVVRSVWGGGAVAGAYICADTPKIINNLKQEAIKD